MAVPLTCSRRGSSPSICCRMKTLFSPLILPSVSLGQAAGRGLPSVLYTAAPCLVQDGQPPLILQMQSRAAFKCLVGLPSDRALHL